MPSQASPHLLQGLLPAVALVAEWALELLVVRSHALSRLLLLLLLLLSLWWMMNHDLCLNGQSGADEAALTV